MKKHTHLTVGGLCLICGDVSVALKKTRKEKEFKEAILKFQKAYKTHMKQKEKEFYEIYFSDTKQK